MSIQNEIQPKTFMDIAIHGEEKYFRRLHPGSVGWSPSGFFKPDFSPLSEMKISFDPPMQFPLVAGNYSIIRHRLLTWEKVTLLHPALATFALKWCPVTNSYRPFRRACLIEKVIDKFDESTLGD